METKPCLTGTRSWQRGGISTCGGTITIYLLRYFNPAPSWESAEKSLSKQNLKVMLPPSLLNWKVALKKKKKPVKLCNGAGCSQLAFTLGTKDSNGAPLSQHKSIKMSTETSPPLYFTAHLCAQCLLAKYDWKHRFALHPRAQTTGTHRRARPPPAPAGRSCHGRAESSASTKRRRLSHSLPIGLRISEQNRYSNSWCCVGHVD